MPPKPMTGNAPRTTWLVILASVALVAGGCNLPSPAPTPLVSPLDSSITRATTDAYITATPVDPEERAVVEAAICVGHTRINSVTPPRAESIDRMRAADAQRRLDARNGTGYAINPPDADVWYVVLTGTWQIVPPGPDATSLAPFVGPVYTYVSMTTFGCGGITN